MRANHGFTSVKGNTWCDVCGERADQHEPEGTFACPICGKESIHSHTSLEILGQQKPLRAVDEGLKETETRGAIDPATR